MSNNTSFSKQPQLSYLLNFIMKFLSILALVAVAKACLLPEERDGGHLVKRKSYWRRQSNGAPIGTGDRFSGGTIVPQGLGTQTTSFSTILSVAEVSSGFEALASSYDFPTFTAPYTTFEGRTIYGGTVGGSAGTCVNAYRAYFNANIHARERGSADGLLYFISDLLYANKNGVGIRYGSKSYTNAQVKTALTVGIVFVPMSNPDGTNYDQTSNSCWRKNRNTKSGSSGASVGVDLNRNFDFVWDFTTKFASSVASSVASTNPSSETYHGTAVFSEPETKAIKWVLDTYPMIRYFIDLHSYTGDVLYSWGSDENQSKYAYMNFLNSTYNSVRGILSDTPGSGSGYGEYSPTQELADNKAVGVRIGAAMSAAAGRTYTVTPAANLYPTSGASDDYSYSRHFANTALNLVHSYTIEFGFGNSASSCPFYPTVAQYNTNLQEIGAAYMETLLAAVDTGLGDAVTC
ncbi:hypothetical protein BJ878DRAFT_504408 [Calycina marina]|uniref:Peptidase M14 domain-containing protein n=1 Tax=Calycina marina TaxID=1763456 RepID=A0A9P8CF59_9HELO|nr:hypothetical protein BJ878DRAFT_504408 [Calycina marina]